MPARPCTATLLFAVERVNRRGGVKCLAAAAARAGSATTARARARSRWPCCAALDRHAAFVAQGNSSAVAAAIVEALNKHNERTPDARCCCSTIPVDPVPTNEKCSFWHFRFDAHADMRLAALVEVLRRRRGAKVYLIGQDYSFGQHVRRRAHRRGIAPDIEIVGDELHPIGRVKDLPHAMKVKGQRRAGGADRQLGQRPDAADQGLRDVGVEARIYSFYGNARCAGGHRRGRRRPRAGRGRVAPNVDTPASRDFHAAFRARFPKPEDYQHARMQVMVEMLAQAIERAGSDRGRRRGAVRSKAARYDGRTLGGLHSGSMRAADHQFIQPLVVSVMDKLGAPACASTMKARLASAPCVLRRQGHRTSHTAGDGAP